MAPMDMSNSPAIISNPMRDNADLGRNVEPAGDTGNGDERVAADDREENEDRDHAEERPGFGAP